jgi:hypothetical protein
MRSAGNFNSEWGYLAPAPSFMRTVRVVLVATAIGATAGAAVVISLIDRPAGEGTASLAPRAIVTSAQAAPLMAVPAVAAAPVAAPIAQTTAALPVAPQAAVSAAAQTAASTTPAVNASAPSGAVAPSQPSLATAVPANSAPSEAGPIERNHSTGMAALSEASPAGERLHAADATDQSLLPPEPLPEDKKARHRVASAAAMPGKSKSAPNLGSMLRRIFNPPTGRSYYPNR